MNKYEFFLSLKWINFKQKCFRANLRWIIHTALRQTNEISLICLCGLTWVQMTSFSFLFYPLHLYESCPVNFARGRDLVCLHAGFSPVNTKTPHSTNRAGNGWWEWSSVILSFLKGLILNKCWEWPHCAHCGIDCVQHKDSWRCAFS